MRLRHILPLLLILNACQSKKAEPTAKAEPASQEPTTTAETAPKADIRRSVVRINSTQQTWNLGQPWEKNPPSQRHALAA